MATPWEGFWPSVGLLGFLAAPWEQFCALVKSNRSLFQFLFINALIYSSGLLPIYHLGNAGRAPPPLQASFQISKCMQMYGLGTTTPCNLVFSL